MQILCEQLIFFLTLAWLFVVPGVVFARAFVGRSIKLSALELFVAGFGVGVILLNFILIILNKTFNLPLTHTTILLTPLITIISSIFILYWQGQSKESPKQKYNFGSTNTSKSYDLLWLAKLFDMRRLMRISSVESAIEEHNATSLVQSKKIKTTLTAQQSTSHKNISTSSTYTPIATLLIVLTIAIKAFYLADTAFSTATDMGHHLYWVNKIAATHELQDYKKQEILTDTATGTYTISTPQHVPDFIIGEHIPLAAVQITTGANILSPEPVLFLFALDILSLLALFVLMLRLCKSSRHAHAIALATLFLMGPLYTLSASQAKFISGGVIGNLFGNLFIPLALLFLYRALTEKSSRFLTLFLITVTGLVYTHHLSTFILAYVIAFIVGFFVLTNITTLWHHVRHWCTLIFSPSVLITLALAALFLAFVHIPSYLNPDAISSATGAPSKDTRTGVGIVQLISTIGEARFAFGLVGLAVVFISTLIVGVHTFWSAKLMRTTRIMGVRIVESIKERVRRSIGQNNPYAVAILLGWPIAIFAMSTIPQYLGVNIISSRIANYTILPFALVGAVGLWWLISTARAVLPHTLAFGTGTLLILFALTSGMADNNQSLKTTPNITQALETYAAATYLAPRVGADDWVVKDHNYLIADTWMKLFFLRDYSYPLSRSYFGRYETNNRETCTLDMISAPLKPHAQQCFTDLNVRYIVVEPSQDAAQFMKAPAQFDRIYSSNHITVFYRNVN